MFKLLLDKIFTGGSIINLQGYKENTLLIYTNNIYGGYRRMATNK